MKIYTAGFYQRTTSATGHSRAAAMANPPHILESFHYIGSNPKWAKMIRADKRTVFLDSGAFSMFTQGIKVDLNRYARFVLGNRDIFHAVSNLDVIGKGNELESYKRQKQLETLLGKDIVYPVHHARDQDKWLERYLAEGYDYIFLGGMVPETTNYLYIWLDRMFDKYLTNDDGTAKVKVHGFGLTTQELMFRYPWYSVDSTRWVMASMFGTILLDMPQPDGTITDYIVDMSTRSPRKENLDSWHYSTMTPEFQKQINARLEELEAVRCKSADEPMLEEQMGFRQGYNPKALSESYGWRDHFNINYMVRAEHRATQTFINNQPGLLT
jgi:hypothetical protein